MDSSDHRENVSKWIWVFLWAILCFAPSIMLQSGSKVSPAVVFASIYLVGRAFWRPLPPLDHSPFLLALLLCLYLFLQGFILSFATVRLIVILLQGQWIAYFLAGFLLAFDIGQTRSGRSFLAYSLSIIGLISSIFGLISVYTGAFYEYAKHVEARWNLPINRAVGTYEAPSVLASMLVICFLLYFFMPVTRSSLSRKISLAIIMIAIIATQSKAGVLGTLAAIPIGGVLSRKARMVVTSLILFCVAGAAVYSVTKAYHVDLTVLVENDVQGRDQIAKHVLDKYVTDGLAEQVFGIGFRQSAVRSAAGAWITAHNSYVSFLREIGVIGLVLVCAFTVVVLVKAMSPELFPWGMALIGLLMISDTETFLYVGQCVLFLGAAGGIACWAPVASRSIHLRAPAPGDERNH